jgi:hypothetical protein
MKRWGGEEESSGELLGYLLLFHFCLESASVIAPRRPTKRPCLNKLSDDLLNRKQVSDQLVLGVYVAV